MRSFFVCALAAALLGAVTAQSQVTYSLSDPVSLLDADYYAGEPGLSTPAAPSGRFAFIGKPSKDGTKIAFIGVNNDYADWGIFLVDIGDPSSWRRIAGPFFTDLATPLGWSPDQSHVYVDKYRLDLTTGATEVTGYAFDVDDNPTIIVRDGNTALLSDGYWMFGTGQDQITALPIHADGSYDGSREPVVLTNFNLGGASAEWPTVSPTGSMIGFALFTGFPMPTPELSDVYVLNNVEAILSAPKLSGTDISSLAPTSLADPNIVAIRTTEDAVDYFAHVPTFAQDESLVFYGEDWNNVFNDDDLFGTIAVGNWDVMISNSDGSGTDFRITDADPFNPTNEVVEGVTPGGIRIIYMSGVGSSFGLYATSLQTETAVTGDDISNSTVDVDLGGGQIVQVNTGDNALQVPPAAAEPVVVSDASETIVTLPPGQVVDFPSGAPQSLTISTPVNPAESNQLPPDVNGIPVLREFGPEGAQFYPPVQITISYTDAEVAGLVESSLLPYVFNTTTQQFEPVDPGDVLVRDTANNEITFRVDHFSLYGIGGTSPALPMSQTALAILAGLLAALPLLVLAKWHKSRAEANTQIPRTTAGTR